MKCNLGRVNCSRLNTLCLGRLALDYLTDLYQMSNKKGSEYAHLDQVESAIGYTSETDVQACEPGVWR
jgi:hypothetical protein